MNSFSDDTPERRPRSHHGREHLPPDPMQVTTLVWAYKADLKTRLQILKDHIAHESFYHPVQSLILAQNILNNEDDAVVALDNPSVNEDREPSLHNERKLILSQAALLLMFAAQDLDDMDMIAQNYVNRINAIETKQYEAALAAETAKSKDTTEAKPAKPSVKLTLTTLDTIQKQLDEFITEAKRDRRRPRSKWLGSGATWSLRPKNEE